MANGIHNVAQFCRELNVHDVFWHITSYHGKPYTVEGPCEIRDIFWDRNVLKVQYVRPWVEINDSITEDAISDLVNEYHGVFRDERSARAYLEERKRMYAADPYFAARIQRQEEETGRMQFFGERA